MSLGQGAGQIVPGAVSTAGTALTPQIATWLSLTVPVVGGIIAGVTLALTLFFNRKRPRQKEAASRAADELEGILQQNLSAYLASPRTVQEQAAALANFDAGWSWLTSPEGCGHPELGEPGRNCIAERQRGGSAAWCPTGTGCDWFILYRDPIANDSKPAERVQTSALLPGLSIPGLTTGADGGGVSPLLVGLLVAGLGLTFLAVSE